MTRDTCAAMRSVSFRSRNSSGFLSISFLIDCPARYVSFESSKRTYILPSNAASFPNKIGGGLSWPINLSLSLGLFRPYSVSLLLSASISLAEIVPSFCQFSKSRNKLSIRELSAWSLIGVSRRHLLSRRCNSIFSSPFRMTMASILSRSKLTTFCACRLASSVPGCLSSKNLK